MTTAGRSSSGSFRHDALLAAFLLAALGRPVSASTSIVLSASSGYPGATVTVSGGTRAGAAGVRILRRDAQTAAGAADTAVDRLGNYQQQIMIPSDTAPGPVRLCAFERGPGALGDDMVCQVFNVVTPPPGSISGIVRDRTGAPVPGATVRLSTATGAPEQVSTTNQNGYYLFPTVPPGPRKLYAFKDGLSAFGTSTVDVQPGEGADGSLGEEDPFYEVRVFDAGVVAISVAPPYQDIETTLGTYTYPFGPFAYTGPYSESPVTWVRFYVDFGTFISGLNPLLDFHDGLPPQAMNFGPVVPGSPRYGFPAFWLEREASSRPPGTYNVDVIAYLSGSTQVYSNVFNFTAYDLTSRWLNPWVGGRSYTVTPHPTSVTYTLHADLPEDPTLSYSHDLDLVLHTFSNKIDANVGRLGETPSTFERFAEDQVEGTPGDEGVLQQVPALQTRVTLLDSTLIDDTYPYQVVQGSNGVEYVIPQFTAASSSQFVSFRLYQAGPGVGCLDIPLCFIDCTVEVCAGWDIYVDFAMAGSVDLASTIHNDLSVDLAVTPAVDATLGGHFRAEAVICSASADLTGTVGVGLPFRYESVTPSAGFEDPCVTLSAYVGGSLGCAGIDLGAGGDIGPYTFGCSDSGSSMSLAAGSAPPHAATASPIAGIHPNPAITANDAGEALAVWVQGEPGTLTSVQPFVYYGTYDGHTWSQGARLTAEAAAVDSPRVAFLDRNRALAVWTQNRRTLTEALVRGDPHDLEIYSAVWNGTRWTTPMAVTNNDHADGRAALAVRPQSGQAIAAWVEATEMSSIGAPTGVLRIYYSIFDGEGWSTPAPIDATSGAFDYAVALSFDADGNAWAVWVRDTDRNLMTFADRQLVIARWSGGRWGLSTPIPNTPPGAFAPSLAVDEQGRPLVVFTVPPTFPDGSPGSGVGNRSTLWSAFNRGRIWEVGRVADGLYAEQPVAQVAADGQAIVMFRGFSPDGSVHKDGDLATAVANLGATRLEWGAEYLTEDGQTNWQTAFALAPGARQQFVVNVKQDSRNSAAAAPRARMRFATASVVTRAVADAPAAPVVALMEMPYAPDLSVQAADVTVSDSHPLAGDTIRITATVHNRGHEAAGAFAVEFIDSSSGTRIGRVPVAGPLPIGVGVPVSVDYAVREGGLHTVAIVADARGAVAESDETNNRAEITFGRPPAPLHPAANRLPVLGRTPLAITWERPEGRGLAGFRIYRSAVASTGYELVGETTRTRFVDALADDMTAYHYVVATIDDAGVRSAFSKETNVPAAAPCHGDCDGGRAVTIDELLVMVNIALGNVPPSACGAGDANGDGQITVNEIIAGVNNALNGCS